MYPIEIVSDFAEITNLVVTGVAFGLILFFTIYFISWGCGLLITFFKNLGS